ncbi:laccase [Nocardioides sp. Root1257]|uniref:polyphenol oxidase family protein n=1 Tax=unclassified Nocardioides TaxID=2615069 RepID=UPI0007002B97|nr:MULTISPECIES: polyphenol oxidase family protein [unclassified Nocardioides]KQW53324.1 laccase [Nocardioides sp. Root1257]KRC56010.1 laccase [Nocardioides sp. Root224]
MTFLFHDTVPVTTGTVSVAFTERRLDLGDHAEPAVREAALAEIAAETGATPYLMHQVHGTAVHVPDGADAAFPDADALVTGAAGLALLARAADCVPVLLVAESGEVGAVHAGREGVRRGVVPAALRRLDELGATGVRAWVGPHICGACYEVPEAMRAEVAAEVPATAATTSWGTPSLDLGAGVRSQLEAAGVAVVEVGACTREDEALHSFRRDGAAAGRLAGVVWRTA